ncbi:MAG: LysR family transcriptional regulator [Woeseiaceae bacterium]|nr:LysR family transcriptional regulator [Woeseiaceae bacterium]
MDRFEDLQAFAAVVEAGSFTSAAERLDMAKSAVSRRVARLEERLGVQLIRRTTRRLNVTDSGQSFYERAARILADLDEAESAVAQAHGELRGELRIALPLGFALRHMSEPIAEFSRDHPKVRFHLDLNDRRVDLLEEGVDLAIRIGQLSDSSLIARKLFDAKTVVCASPGYIAANGAPQTLDDLADHPCLVYDNLAEPERWVCTDTDGSRREVIVNIGMRATSGEFLRECAAEDLGIIIQPTFLVSDAICEGRLVPILTRYRWPVTPAYAVYPPTRHLSYRVRTFIDFVAARYADGTPWDVACDEIERSA